MTLVDGKEDFMSNINVAVANDNEYILKLLRKLSENEELLNGKTPDILLVYLDKPIDKENILIEDEEDNKRHSLEEKVTEIIHEIGVHLDAVFIGSKVYPFGFNVDQPVTLLEEDNIRSDLRTGSSLKGIVRQTDCSEKVSSLRDILTDSRVLLVHCSF